MEALRNGYPQRRHPARTVHIHQGQPTIVFLTVCTRHRKPWLADNTTHTLIRRAWEQADRWWVGDYLLMPDHAHLFVWPRDLASPFDNWVRFWKSHFSKSHRNPACRWQQEAFHHRLRNRDEYHQKWNYVLENPVRAGLVQVAEEWPYRGCIHHLGW